MNKTFNYYCDESSHLENDHKKYMLLGRVSSAYNMVRINTEKINQIKKRHNFYGEIKWSNVSNSQCQFYFDLIDYFFDSDLEFRTIIVDKTKVDNERYHQAYDTFYYKMYYLLLFHNININYTYNVYLDIKDTLSAHKVEKLKEILNTRFGVFRNVQNIRSHESLIMQITDLLTGAIAYKLNYPEMKVNAKKQIIDKIIQRSNQSLDSTSFNNETKLNLFFINL